LPVAIEANSEKDLVYSIGGGVSRFRKQTARPGEQSTDQLCNSDGYIREERDDDSARTLSLGNSPKSCGGPALRQSSQYSRQVSLADGVTSLSPEYQAEQLG
jgi:hypothetical protein